MAFEKFKNQGGGKCRSPFPLVFIWKHGAAGFNVNAIKLCKLDKHNFAEIYFDKDANRIGFRFVPKKTEHSRSITKRRSGCSVSIRAFLKYHKIDYSVARRYRLEFDEENGLYVIQL